MLAKVGKDWQFTSENNLEDFVWSQLNQLFELSPLKRQYSIFDNICDILATDKDGRLVIIELKNAVDRHIVQQLTRYHHSLLEEKPFQAQINYQLPARLIAIAPSFHRHSWIDQQYHQLTFEFMSFTIKQQHNRVYLHITDLNTQRLLQAKILDTSLIEKVKISQPTHTALVMEDGEIKFTKVLDDMLSYYVLVRNAHKLGLPELEVSEIERLNN